MPKLDLLIHQPVRLQIMAALVVLCEGDHINFACLRDMLNLSDGNLGAHLLKLEDAGYIEQEKTYVDRRPCTFLSVTAKGRAAFQDHVLALKDILK